MANNIKRERATKKLGDNVSSIENLADLIIVQHEYNLDYRQQKLLGGKNKSFRNLLQLVREVYESDYITEQDEEFKNVRRFTQRTGKYYNFTHKDIDFILENGEDMRPSEMIEELYEGQGGDILKIKTCQKLLNACGVKYKGEDFANDLKTESIGAYVPPKGARKVIEIINNIDPTAKLSFSTNYTGKRKECVDATLNYLNSVRFMALANSISDKTFRNVYETEFIRAVWDKPDLSAEHLNQYIGLAFLYQQQLVVSQQMSYFNDRILECVSDDENTRKMSHSYAEALKDRTQLMKNINDDISKLVRTLSGDRKEHLKLMADKNASLNSFVEKLMEEHERERMLRMQKARELKISDKIQEIDETEAYFGEVFGLDKEELI